MKSAKLTFGSTVALVTLVAICIVGLRAQQTSSQSSSPVLTTNWVGYLVAGRLDTYDRISAQPSPTVDRHVEIGLRSDGVVIWRETTNADRWSVEIKALEDKLRELRKTFREDSGVLKPWQDLIKELEQKRSAQE